MQTLRIGLAQCRQVDDFDANAATIFRFIDEAAEAGVQILCFPEAQTVGYRVDIVAADAPVPVAKLHDLHDRVARRCGELKMACILGTEIPHESDPHKNKPYNSTLIISESGEILGTHHKARLTPLDAVAYSPGETFDAFELCGVTIGVVICFEGFRFAETTQECVRRGAQLIFHPQNNTTRPLDWKIPVQHAMITTRAAENTVWLASCNCCHVPHQNCRSMIIAPDGRVHAQARMKHEEILVSDIDIDLATRAMFDFNTSGYTDSCADVLFADTVKREEYAEPETSP